jgi:hypothetical protein
MYCIQESCFRGCQIGKSSITVPRPIDSQNQELLTAIMLDMPVPSFSDRVLLSRNTFYDMLAPK